MRLTFLGTGTSAGVPLIGCDCNVCTSSHKNDQRLRSSVLFSNKGKNLVVDTGPDFRTQMLQEKVQHIHGVLFTHEHRDHIAGLDDTRPFMFWSGKPIEVFCESSVETAIRRDFYYAFHDNPYPGSPKFNLNNVLPETSFSVGGFDVMPLRVMHGNLPILGFKVGGFAYITDANYLPQSTLDAINGIDVLVLNALRMEAHHSHYNFDEAIEVAKKTNAKRVYFTHISHQLGLHSEIEKQLPPNFKLAYDGLQIDL